MCHISSWQQPLSLLVKSFCVVKEIKTFWAAAANNGQTTAAKMDSERRFVFEWIYQNCKFPIVVFQIQMQLVFCSVFPENTLFLWVPHIGVTKVYISTVIRVFSVCTLVHKTTAKAKIKTSRWRDQFICMSPHYPSATPSIYFVLVKCTFMLAFANCSFYLTERLIAGTCSSGHGAHQRQNESQQRSIDYSGISSSRARLPL